jgi:hypothetical protein
MSEQETAQVKKVLVAHGVELQAEAIPVSRRFPKMLVQLLEFSDAVRAGMELANAAAEHEELEAVREETDELRPLRQSVANLRRDLEDARVANASLQAEIGVLEEDLAEARRVLKAGFMEPVAKAAERLVAERVASQDQQYAEAHQRGMAEMEGRVRTLGDKLKAAIDALKARNCLRQDADVARSIAELFELSCKNANLVTGLRKELAELRGRQGAQP